MADAAGDEPDEDLAVLRLREVELLDLQRLAEFFKDGGAHLHAPILLRPEYAFRALGRPPGAY